MPPILEFTDVHYSYPNCPASLNGVNFAIEKGAKVALVGPNGAGKTTLLLMCNGILRPDKGEICLSGLALRYDSRSLRETRKTVGLVFQNSDSQLFAPTVYQDVAFGPVNLGIDREKIPRMVTENLHAVGLEGYDKRPPHQLSGGEKKRASIAGILVMEPDVLIFDEPTSSLDPAGAADLMELLDDLNAQGKTIIISTHDVELAYNWADDIILMNRGVVIHQGSPDRVFNDPALITTTNLRTPALLEIYTELVARNMLENTGSPRSVLSLVNTLEQKFRQNAPVKNQGTVTVCNVDTTSSENISSWITDNPDHWRGAMGTRAKKLAEQENIALDFTYGVIDKCLLRALIGESSFILTTTGMVERVQRRVLAFDEESGIRVVVSLLGDGTPW
jgi:cobalt/nickel transport system ATP-binding protein